MARLNNVQRIIIEDFEESDRETVSKLANILNFFMTQTVDTINGRLDFDNINSEVVTIEVTVDSNGNPIQPTSFSTNRTIIGGRIENAQNLTNAAVYPTAQPFISYTPTQTPNLYKINNISGLPANNRFRLTYIVTY